MKTNKTLIIIGAGYYQKPIIVKAKEMGYYTVAVDKNNNAVGANIADYHIKSSAHDEKIVVKRIEDILSEIPPVSGVLSGGARGCIRVTAVLSEKLRLLGNNIKKAEILSDKFLMRKEISKLGMNNKAFLKVDNLEQLLKFSKDKKIVLKSSDSSGGKNLFLIDNIDDCAEKYEFLRNSTNENLFAEEYIEGIDIGVTAIAYGDEIIITGVFDRILDGEKFGKVTGYIIPSKINKDDYYKIIKFSANTFNKMGIKYGPCSLELRLSDNGEINLIELEANIPGSFIANYLIEKSTGKDFIKSSILSVTGFKPEFIWNNKKSVSVIFKDINNYKPETKKNSHYQLRKISKNKYAYLFEDYRV